MVSNHNIGCIKNTLVFSNGEVRLKNDEPVKYTVKEIPLEEIELPKMNGKKTMMPCLGGCERMFLTTIEHRICPECEKKMMTSLESYNEVNNSNETLFICNRSEDCKLAKGRECRHHKEHTNVNNKCDTQDIYCEKGGLVARCVEI